MTKNSDSRRRRSPTAPFGDGERGPGGRFAPGNSGGPGNPYARRVAALRSGLLAAVSADDLAAIVRALVEKAKSGDVAAAREVLSRLLGASPTDFRDALRCPDSAAKDAMLSDSELDFLNDLR